MNQTNEQRMKLLQERRSQAQQAIEQSIERLAADLENGSSETLQRCLALMGRFHRYSANNILLIWSQRPEATHVAGFHAWQEMGRRVHRGEKGIMILAPIIRKVLDEEDGERKLCGFKTAHVFDVSQTEGKELPKFATVQGNPEGWLAKIRKAAMDSGIEVHYSEKLGAALGSSSGGKILISQGLPEAEEVSVLVHEWAHEILHQDKSVKTASRTVRETEAEAVAYVVCAAIGLDVNTACSDYIRLYEGGKETLLASLERIKNTASRIMKLAEINEPRRTEPGA